MAEENFCSLPAAAETYNNSDGFYIPGDGYRPSQLNTENLKIQIKSSVQRKERFKTYFAG
jgi:hypothetical protein